MLFNEKHVYWSMINPSKARIKVLSSVGAIIIIILIISNFKFLDK